MILQLEKRLVKRSRQSGGNEKGKDEYLGGPIYLVGYSLGANIVTKYLGEESLHGTLPSCIGGGAALGNPLHIASNSIPFPWNMILAMGVKRSILQNFPVYSQHRERGFHTARKAQALDKAPPHERNGDFLQPIRGQLLISPRREIQRWRCA